MALKDLEIEELQIEYFRVLWHESERYIYYINSAGYFEKCDKRMLNSDSYDESILPVNFTVNKGQSNSSIDGKMTSVRKAVIVKFHRGIIEEGKMYVIHLDGFINNCAIDNLLLCTKEEYDEYSKGKAIYSYLLNGYRYFHYDIESFVEKLGLSSETELRAYYSRYKRKAQIKKELEWLDNYKITMLELGIENNK